MQDYDMMSALRFEQLLENIRIKSGNLTAQHWRNRFVRSWNDHDHGVGSAGERNEPRRDEVERSRLNASAFENHRPGRWPPRCSLLRVCGDSMKKNCDDGRERQIRSHAPASSRH